MKVSTMQKSKLRKCDVMCQILIFLSFESQHEHFYLVTPEISGLAHSRIIGYLLGPSLFLYLIVIFTFSDTYTGLFLARFTFPNLVQGKSNWLSLTLTGFTTSDPSNNTICIYLENIEKLMFSCAFIFMKVHNDMLKIHNSIFKIFLPRIWQYNNCNMELPKIQTNNKLARNP